MLEKITVLANPTLLITLLLALVFMGIGFLLSKYQLVSEEGTKILKKFILYFNIPCLAFSSFMMDYSTKLLNEAKGIILIAILLYVLLLLLGNLFFMKLSKETRQTFAIVFTLSQVTLFAMPIVKQTGDNNALIVINIFSLVFRFFLYIYAYFTLSDTKPTLKNIGLTCKKIFLNPVIIAMLIGFLLWLFQNRMPQYNGYSIFRIDHSAKPLFFIISIAASMTLYLTMFLAGLLLGQCQFKEIFTDKMVWLLAGMRSFLAPIIVLSILLIIQKIGLLPLSNTVVKAITICFAAPISAVVNTFCITYQREAIVVSKTCVLSVILSLISTAIWLILL